MAITLEKVADKIIDNAPYIAAFAIGGGIIYSILAGRGWLGPQRYIAQNAREEIARAKKGNMQGAGGEAKGQTIGTGPNGEQVVISRV